MDINIKEIIIPAAVILVIIWKSFIRPMLQRKLTEAQFLDLIYYIEKLVKIAEVVFNSPGTGVKKKQWVLDKIENTMNLTEEDLKEISKEVDSAVDRLFNQ